MSEFRNALQAASNTAAGTVSGPVDLLAWALRKAGVPVPDDPVLGTEWLRQRGLIGDVKPGVSQMVGDTAGLLSPIAAAAYGPQIARGLLKGGENLAAPRTLNPETGAIVWHGSPHKFDKFDSSKIGTGEGAQAYGHGLYLAESPDVAKSYATNLANRDIANQGRLNAHANAQRLAALAGDAKYAADDIKFALEINPQHEQADLLRGTLEFLESGAYAKPLDNPGALYKVDLPDEAIAKMLDWDKPLSEQAPEVRAVAEALGLGKPYQAGMPARETEAQGMRVYDDLSRQTPGPKAIADAAAAKKLRAMGIPGIRYLDGGSRAAGQGSRNYVVFDDSLLRILERNGQGLLDDVAQPAGLIGNKTDEAMNVTKYQIEHKPMTKAGGAASLDDLLPAFGEDIYGKNALQFFGSGDPREKATLKVMAQVRGKPDAMVTIYRGGPKDMTSVNAGDWVTLDPKVAADYAAQHPGGHVVSMKVPAGHITSWADSLLEFGYFPP